MRSWGMQVYLDAGKHVGVDDRPCYYCGVLNLYRLATTQRCELGGGADLEAAQKRFLDTDRALCAAGGGLVSIYYHPCEFVHERFWDGENFSHGANPPRKDWKLPPMKSPEARETAFDIFTSYIRFIQRLPNVRFVTASDTARLYRDRSRQRKFSKPDIRAIAGNVTKDITFQQREDYALSAAEILELVNRYVALCASGATPEWIQTPGSPLGPADPVSPQSGELSVDWTRFVETAKDVDGYLRRHGQAPPVVWLGSSGVSPETWLLAVAGVACDLIDERPAPSRVKFGPARLAAADQVADDGPGIWKWVIFPDGFHAPAMMELAKRQAWTLKPAVLHAADELTSDPAR